MQKTEHKKPETTKETHKVDNTMRSIKVEKVTLNIGAGKDQTKLEKGMILLKNLTGRDPVKTFAKKRIPTWGIRPGLPIGCKITLRKDGANALLPRLVQAKDSILKQKQFDASGNLSFGIPEYVDIPGVKYDPKIKILGLEVCITLERPGFRIKKRKIRRSHLSKTHKINREEAMNFMKENFNVKLEE